MEADDSYFYKDPYTIDAQPNPSKLPSIKKQYKNYSPTAIEPAVTIDDIPVIHKQAHDEKPIATYQPVPQGTNNLEHLDYNPEEKLPLFSCSQDPEIDDWLEIKETDPIFSTSYEMMIKEAFRDDKHFILAKMKTRSTTNYKQSHSHYFNVFGILKIIFKKRREEIVGRFHHQYPMSAKNPLTNNQIIGEVEFFIFRNPYLELPAENRYPQGETLTLKGVKGEFMGTDYNYLYSEEMKKTIAENCLEANQGLLNLGEYQDPINADWQQFLDRNVNDVQFQNDIQEIIQSSFIHSNKFYIHGALACVYFLAAISTFLAGLSSFFENQHEDSDDTDGPTLYYDPYTIILPIAVIVFDCDMRRVYKRKEKLSFSLIRLVFWVLFYIIFGLAASQETNDLIKLANMMFLVWPCLAAVYSFLLMKFPFFSVPMPNQERDYLQRFEQMINQRHLHMEQRQQNFDEQNFGGEQLIAIDINNIQQNQMDQNSSGMQQHINLNNESQVVNNDMNGVDNERQQCQ